MPSMWRSCCMVCAGLHRAGVFECGMSDSLNRHLAAARTCPNLSPSSLAQGARSKQKEESTPCSCRMRGRIPSAAGTFRGHHSRDLLSRFPGASSAAATHTFTHAPLRKHMHLRISLAQSRARTYSLFMHTCGARTCTSAHTPPPRTCTCTHAFTHTRTCTSNTHTRTRWHVLRTPSRICVLASTHIEHTQVYTRWPCTCACIPTHDVRAYTHVRARRPCAHARASTPHMHTHPSCGCTSTPTPSHLRVHTPSHLHVHSHPRTHLQDVHGHA